MHPRASLKGFLEVPMKNIAIFASGNGSNFLAIYDAIQSKELHAEITLLVSDKSNSKSVENGVKLGLNVFSFSASDYDSKVDYEKKILDKLIEHNVDMIVLAGYMRLIGKTLLDAYEGKIINIHPSLLPEYKGKDAIGQAMNDNAEISGVTVHYVDEGMDTGKIIEQVEVDISNFSTRAEIEKEIHKIEHVLYKKVIKQLLEETG